MKCVYVYNKIDVIGIDDVDKLARQPNSVVISCNLKVGSTIVFIVSLNVFTGTEGSLSVITVFPYNTFAFSRQFFNYI